jgi:hypothetical protein
MKELDDNLLNTLVQSILESRKEPKQEPGIEPELPEDIKRLEDLKRARYEALLEKYKD